MEVLIGFTNIKEFHLILFANSYWKEFWKYSRKGETENSQQNTQTDNFYWQNYMTKSSGPKWHIREANGIQQDFNLSWLNTGNTFT